MLFIIHAYENIYGGLHGIEDFAIIEAEDEKIVQEYGYDLSCEVIDGYSDIRKSFEEDAEAEGIEEGTDEWESYIEDLIDDDVCFDYWQIKETDKTTEELDTLVFNIGLKDFVNKYCVNE